LLRPMPLLQGCLNKTVRVYLKNELAYEGLLVECDEYMNMLLENAVEYNNGGERTKYGKVLIRGNNIQYVVISHL
jgi:small nuclear ribonucleoprotein (snRNP)-like protein